MGYFTEGIMDPVIAFVYTLNYLPEKYSRHKSDEELMITGIRENIGEVANFHPQIDSELGVNLTLEKVIRNGITEFLIEFFTGIRAVRAERCYQIMQQEGISVEDLPKQRILQVRKQVIADYKSLWTGERVTLTEKTKDPEIREAQAVLEFLSALSK